MELHEDRARASSFGAAAELYDRARPSYPAAMVDDLCVSNPSSVLDVGCGTGIASRLFVVRGCTVIGVEQDERMAAVARAHGIDVDVAAFETWTPRADTVRSPDLGAGLALDRPRGGSAASGARARSGGRFGAFWNVSSHEPEMREAMVAVYERNGRDIAHHAIVLGVAPTEWTLPPAARGFAEGPDFSEIETRTYDWTRRYQRDEWLDQIQTHSDHALLRRDTLDALLADVGALIDERGGEFDVGYRTVMITVVRN